MTSTNTVIDIAVPAAHVSDATNTSNASKKRMKDSSEVHKNRAKAPALAVAAMKTRGVIAATVPETSVAGVVTAELPRQTKASVVEALLDREGGASLEAMCQATGWQAHTCRAFLTGLRKKGREVIRASDKDGKSIYLIATERSPASSSAVAQTGAETK